MKKVIQKIILAGVVLDNNKVLILQRNSNEDIYPNLWELPSGKKENLETPHNALIREIKEEAGLDIEIIMPISVFDYKIEKEDEIRDSVQINFLVSVKNNNVFISKEHQKYKWIKKEEVDNYEISDNTKNVIIKGFELNDKIKRQN